MNYQSNTVLITGASRGLGANFSKVLAAEGFKIIGVGRNKKNLKSVISNLPNQNLEHEFLEIDITNEQEVFEKLSGLNIYGLVNNAGIANTKLLHEETYSNLSKIFNTNLLGSMNVSNAIIPNMIKNKSGKIINIASTLGYRPLSYVGAYSATKAALIQVTKSQSIELARFNICVNALAPGYILTDINKEQLEGDAGVLLKKKIPLKRFATAEELDVIISMLLNRHNTYMTGAVIAVDGGLSAGL
ncbi:SDR family oxidoreductase [Alphaproteobacteria bacterium]|jgi:NAD(P)-dependent dehydrogenase (short-subunit alcohol dehydrogenase family)|nr:SDR family oxidoreductase [Alphaproteobacteria bacterium]MDA9148725.1 SDR family oxidoreductase [Alphaproteobacteria bacterium]MDA9806287.1 SDR family oxidoreductase [Alphaproteobacteria bacterium]MDB2387778.1 SDR family oxidoreductase [Alphaproteobacteria bacterium]MDB2478678.1 SDR family oxidoreductase [Alphaproteobacteria bacterium]